MQEVVAVHLVDERDVRRRLRFEEDVAVVRLFLLRRVVVGPGQDLLAEGRRAGKKYVFSRKKWNGS